MIFWIHKVDYIDNKPPKEVFEKYITEVIALLDENIYKVFNLPKLDRDANTDAIYLEREYSVLCSPRFVLANVCNDLYRNKLIPKLKHIYTFDWNSSCSWTNTAMYNLTLRMEYKELNLNKSWIG